MMLVSNNIKNEKMSFKKKNEEESAFGGCMYGERQKRVHVGAKIVTRSPTVLEYVGYVEIPNFTAYRKPVKYVGAVGAIVQVQPSPPPHAHSSYLSNTMFSFP